MSHFVIFTVDGRVHHFGAGALGETEMVRMFEVAMQEGKTLRVVPAEGEKPLLLQGRYIVGVQVRSGPIPSEVTS